MEYISYTGHSSPRTGEQKTWCYLAVIYKNKEQDRY